MVMWFGRAVSSPRAEEKLRAVCAVRTSSIMLNWGWRCPQGKLPAAACQAARLHSRRGTHCVPAHSAPAGLPTVPPPRPPTHPHPVPCPRHTVRSAKWRGKGRKKKKKSRDEEDLYALLGLKHERWMATADQIKAAYRRAALLHHPDKLVGVFSLVFFFGGGRLSVLPRSSTCTTPTGWCVCFCVYASGALFCVCLGGCGSACYPAPRRQAGGWLDGALPLHASQRDLRLPPCVLWRALAQRALPSSNTCAAHPACSGGAGCLPAIAHASGPNAAPGAPQGVHGMLSSPAEPTHPVFASREGLTLWPALAISAGP